MRTSRLHPLLLAWCVACASGPQPGSGPESAPDEAPRSASDQMLDHFSDATDARDAVIAGRLQDVRAPLGRLANAPDARDLPPDWLPWLDEMRAAASRGARATTLLAAAESVAALGATCGECHRTTRGGPEGAADPPYEPGGEKGLKEKMARHAYAADELWLGLTGPVHQAWSNGAATLMNITVPGLLDHRGDPATQDRPPSGEGDLQGAPDPRLPPQEPAGEPADQPASAGTVDLDPELRALRALGTQADKAAIGAEKEKVFAEVIARCGTCHQRLGIQP